MTNKNKMPDSIVVSFESTQAGITSKVKEAYGGCFSGKLDDIKAKYIRADLFPRLEKVEGLDEALEHDFADIVCSDVNDSVIAKIYEAARKYKALSGGNDDQK